MRYDVSLVLPTLHYFYGTRYRKMSVRRRAKLAYIFVAFSSAAIFHLTGSNHVLAAQATDYVARSEVEVEKSETDRLEGRADQIDKHLEATDNRARDASDQISTLRGEGIGASAALGVLQIIGLIRERKEKNEDSL
jgi:hypothetical protein